MYLHLSGIKKRQDFLRLSSLNYKWVSPAFILQIASTLKKSIQPSMVRIGFVVSCKIGNSVSRNKCKRRLKALSHIIFPLYGKEFNDYILIARYKCLTRNFNFMKNDLIKGLEYFSEKLDNRND